MEKDFLLSVKDLHIAFAHEQEEVQVVEGVNLLIPLGVSMGLVGESGSGKSVTALSVMGLLNRRTARILSGEILFRHPQRGVIDLLKLSETQWQEIRGRYMGMIFQEPMTSLNPVKRCGWQAMECLLWHRLANEKQAKRKVLELFEEVQLPDPAIVFQKYPHELSGGQRQRVMIAMAMACEPALLIADEPTTALDVTVQKGILALMKDLQARHQMSIFFISHDLGVIREVCSQVAVMRKGRIVEQGPCEAVFGQPQHPYSRGLVACRPRLDIRPLRLPVVGDFEHNTSAASELKELAAESPEERRKRHQELYAQEPVLCVKNLHAGFVTRKNLLGKPLAYKMAVNDVSFDVWKGETLGLVGESGCGKTTLGRTIMRLFDPLQGEVIYRGIPLTRLRGEALRKFRPRMQIIFQDPYSSLSPGMAIGRAILEPMREHGIGTDDADRKVQILQLLQRVGLQESHYDRYPHEFSGGQRQRVCIARALALRPEFIVCDESVSALDVSVQAQVLNLLNELKREFQLTYIFISHDLSVVKFMSDRILVMQNGVLVEEAEADALYQNPRQAYTQKLLKSVLQA